ncbi:sarcosine oxidase subunit alpha, partial [Rhizobium leguminosarum]|uniref:hypothetical protein n=1 Tax=Rhizobium leguminosarum TaxID=384 RepID=UPI003F9918B8
TQIDSWAESNGAVYEPVGQWRRAWYFPKPGDDMDAAVSREFRAVRKSLGIFDASTLGKIEFAGPWRSRRSGSRRKPWPCPGCGRSAV